MTVVDVTEMMAVTTLKAARRERRGEREDRGRVEVGVNCSL